MSPAIIVMLIGLVGGSLYVGRQIRAVLLQRRNMKHYERDEPLEGGVDKWD